jgi:hypothetical protein
MGPTSQTTTSEIDGTLLDRFELQSRIADWLALGGLMSYAFGYATHWKTYLPAQPPWASFWPWLEAIRDFLVATGWPAALALLAIGSYAAGRIFARTNINQVRSMFADENTPTGIQIVGRMRLLGMIWGQLAVVLVLVVFSSRISVAAACWGVLQAFYLYFNREQRYWLSSVFTDVRYAPRSNHPHKSWIELRRAAAMDYLNRPHDPGELIVLLAAVCAIGLDQAEQHGAFGYGNTLAYVGLVAVITCHEGVLFVWRRKLGARIHGANMSQLVADIRRGL